MNRYLIEVPHGPNKKDCDMAIKIFLQTGSHFLSHADWGCHDGEHKAWMIVDVENKEEARLIVPPIFRSVTKVTQLTNFTWKDIDDQLNYHQA